MDHQIVTENLRTPRVLFVEDTPDTQRIIEMAFSRNVNTCDADLVIADNAEIGLLEYQAAKQLGEPFDLIVSDIAMPDQSGLAMIQAIRDGGDEQTKVIFYTAYDGAINRQTSQDLGAVDYITKPTELGQVMERICNALAASNA